MCLSLRKFRTAAREILELKLRKPRPSREVSFGETEFNRGSNTLGKLGDSIIDLRTRSSSIKSVISIHTETNSDHYNLASNTSYGDYGDYSCDYFDYGSFSCDTPYSYTKKKRLPNTGSNFSKTPILFEIPKILNPAAWVSSKTQKDTKPIKN